MPTNYDPDFGIILRHLHLDTITSNTATTIDQILVLQPSPQTCCRTAFDKNLGMITSSLRRAVRSHPSPSFLSRPATPSIAASFSSQSHQRRHSSSKPPVPPNDGPASVTNPSVKAVGTPRSKDSPTEKRSGAESRLSRRKIPRDRNEQAAGGNDEWTINLPSVPSTQHLDPKGNG